MRNPKHVIIESFESVFNSSSEPLEASGPASVFTGRYEKVINYLGALVSCRTDQAGTLQVYFSDDGEVDDSVTTFQISANDNEVHRLIVSRPFLKVVFTNTSGVAQTVFRLKTTCNNFPIANAPKNSVIGQDADAILVRPSNYEAEVVLGNYQGINIVNKLGRNPSVNTADTPVDVWEGGGFYAGFPTGAPEEIQVVSTNALDTGVVSFSYLATSNSTAYQTGTATLNGTTPVNTGITAYRIFTASYVSGSPTAMNAGTITIRHRTTTANIFATIAPNRASSATSQYTVPAGSTGVIKRIIAGLIQNSGAQVECSIWIRAFGSSPRLRRTFSVSNLAPYNEPIYGGLPVPEKSDIGIRIVSSNANNVDVIAGYDIEIIKN